MIPINTECWSILMLIHITVISAIHHWQHKINQLVENVFDNKAFSQKSAPILHYTADDVSEKLIRSLPHIISKYHKLICFLPNQAEKHHHFDKFISTSKVDFSTNVTPTTPPPTNVTGNIGPQNVTTGCGIDVGCFRMPSGCSGRSCQAAVSYVMKGDFTHFMVTGNVGEAVAAGKGVYMSIGMNHQPKMVNITAWNTCWHK